MEAVFSLGGSPVVPFWRSIATLLVAPVLFLALMLGPLGFLLCLVLRSVITRFFGGRSRPSLSIKGGAGA